MLRNHLVNALFGTMYGTPGTMINENAKFTISSYPYNYLIVEDLFDEGTAFGLSAVFNDLIRTGRPVGKSGRWANWSTTRSTSRPKLSM